MPTAGDPKVAPSATLRAYPVSYGGSGTNWLCARFEAAGIMGPRPWWDEHACHAPAPPIEEYVGAFPIYIYRRPALAYGSQLRRGLVPLNLHKLGGADPGESDEAAFDRLATEQMSVWLSAAMGHSGRFILVRYESLSSAVARMTMCDSLKIPAGHLDDFVYQPRTNSIFDDAFPRATAAWTAMPDMMAARVWS